MKAFEDALEALQPLDAMEIDYYYCKSYAAAVLRCLQKLGMKENEIYRFAAKKKRLRGIAPEISGFSYGPSLVRSMMGTIAAGGEFYDFVYYTTEADIEGKPVEEAFFANLTNMHFWGSLYNYLRMEVKAPKLKRTPQDHKVYVERGDQEEC